MDLIGHAITSLSEDEQRRLGDCSRIWAVR